MKREIIFRGKRVDNGEWVHGDYCNCRKLDKTVQIRFWKDSSYYACYDVIPETVGQYTGLKDKNGKEIYEGDILQSHSVNRRKRDNGLLAKIETYVVEFGNRACEPYELDEFNGWLAVCKWSKYALSNSLIFSESKNNYWEVIKGDDNLRVIGNIHDNPELLEVE